MRVSNRSPLRLTGGRTLRLVMAGFLASAAFALAGSPRVMPALEHWALGLLFIQWLVLTVAACWWMLDTWAPELSPSILLWVLVLMAPAIAALYSALVLLLGFGLAVDQPAWWLVRNMLLAFLFTGVYFAVLGAGVRHQQRYVAEAATRLAALQARIRPHFLFNALNTIASLIHDRPERAEQATLDLADLLRSCLKSDQSHALADELDLVKRYLRLEALRLEDRLKVDWQLAEDLPLAQTLPPLLLQPLVENAIVHGISRRAEGGELRIEGRRIRFARIRFTISNPLPDPDSRPAEGNRTALDNIRQRLALAYEERYGLKTRIEDGYFIAELTIPVT